MLEGSLRKGLDIRRRWSETKTRRAILNAYICEQESKVDQQIREDVEKKTYILEDLIAEKKRKGNTELYYNTVFFPDPDVANYYIDDNYLFRLVKKQLKRQGYKVMLFKAGTTPSLYVKWNNKSH